MIIGFLKNKCKSCICENCKNKDCIKRTWCYIGSREDCLKIRNRCTHGTYEPISIKDKIIKYKEK